MTSRASVVDPDDWSSGRGFPQLMKAFEALRHATMEPPPSQCRLRGRAAYVQERKQFGKELGRFRRSAMKVEGIAPLLPIAPWPIARGGDQGQPIRQWLRQPEIVRGITVPRSQAHGRLWLVQELPLGANAIARRLGLGHCPVAPSISQKVNIRALVVAASDQRR